MAQSLLRKTLAVFGLGGTTDDFEQFGSTADGSPNFTKDIPTIQDLLSYWTNGWRGALLTAKAPVLQDMNAVMYVHSYLEGYIFQEGLAEWDAGTTYNYGSFVKSVYTGSGGVYCYMSLSDANINHALPSGRASNSNWKYMWGSVVGPTQQVFSSGSGTYTLPSACKWIKVRCIGGGGGGGGGGVGANGSAGGNSTFGTTLIVANGGSGGATNNGAGGAGGTASAGAAVGFGFPGQVGQNGNAIAPGTGGFGGNSAFFSGGGFGQYDTTGGAGYASTGGGGAGGGADAGANPGAGGGAGASVEASITTPSATYAYVVGAGGAGGSLGTNGRAGGAGGSGFIIVDEFYQ